MGILKRRGWFDQWKSENQWRIREIRFTAHLLKRNPLSLLGCVMVAWVVIVSLFAPYLATHEPMTVNLSERFQPPSWQHYFGTDDLGLDIYSRVLYAGLYDLSVALIVLIVCNLIGTTVGIVAGYFGGKIDELLMRISDIFLACPGLILAMAFSVAIQSKSLHVLAFAVALSRWPTYSRLVRGQTLSVKENEYIEAARAVGASHARIMLRHVLPNVISPIIVNSTLDIGRIILFASTLSFIGLGAPPGSPEWGRMVADGRAYIQYAPWIILWPGFMIFITAIGFNLLGDGLRDIFDPRSRTRD